MRKVYALVIVFALIAALLASMTIYITSGDIFTFYEDGSYCTLEQTPFEQCDCRKGWLCDDTTSPTPYLNPLYIQKG